MSPYARKTRRALLPREMLGGIPTAALVALVFLVVIFIYALGWYWFAVPVVLLYCIIRRVSAKDEWLPDIILENISQKDVYIP